MSYSVTTIDDPEKFLGLCEEWNSLHDNATEQDYYFSHDWFYPLLTASTALPAGKLVVFICRQKGELQGLLPCFLVREKKRFFKVNTLGLYGNLYTPRRGAVVRKGVEREVVEAFVDYWCNEFTTEWDLIDFGNLSKKDHVVSVLTDVLAQRKIDVLFDVQFDNVKTYLGHKGGEEFFSSLGKKLRQNIRTGINKFCKKGSMLIWLVQDATQDIDAAIEDYYQIYNESWKKEERDPDFHGNLARYLATKEKLRLFVLYYRDGKDEQDGHVNNIATINDGIYTGVTPPGKDYLPVAANYFVVDNRIAYYLKTAYREKYRNFSAGTVLFWFAARHFLEIDHCSIIDHQKGKEAYKLKWGDVYETRYRLQTANPASFIGQSEMWLTNNLLPLLRTIKTVFVKK